MIFTVIPLFTALFAASTLEYMPPVPTIVPAPPALPSSSDVISSTTPIGKNDESFRTDEARHKGGEVVVVAKANLVGSHRIILIDDRHNPMGEQCNDRIP